MKQLAAVSTPKVTINKKGKEEVESYKASFQIRGEEGYDSEEVTFRVLAVRNKIMLWDDAGTKVLNESVLFTMDDLNDQNIPDVKGGNACGRTFAAWENKKYTPEQRKAAARGTKWYTFLFGEVTFPGKKPEIVNYRLTGSQSMDWGTTEKEIKEDISGALLRLDAEKLESNQKYAKADYAILQKGLDTVDASTVEVIANYIQAENDKIIDAFHATSPKHPKPVAKAEDDLSDPVPF